MGKSMPKSGSFRKFKKMRDGRKERKNMRCGNLLNIFCVRKAISHKNVAIKTALQNG